jgi:hypothetical protein
MIVKASTYKSPLLCSTVHHSVWRILYFNHLPHTPVIRRAEHVIPRQTAIGRLMHTGLVVDEVMTSSVVEAPTELYDVVMLVFAMTSPDCVKTVTVLFLIVVYTILPRGVHTASHITSPFGVWNAIRAPVSGFTIYKNVDNLNVINSRPLSTDIP